MGVKKEKKNISQEELLSEVQELRVRLAEAEETLRAIRSGEVDALVVTGAQGEQVFTLKGAEQPYRVLIEEMKEGAVILAEDDTILYCNHGFAQMLKMPLEQMAGSRIEDFILSTDKQVLRELIRKGKENSAKGEVTFIAGDGAPLPVHISINSLLMDGASVTYLIITDLTEHRQAEEKLGERAVLLDKANDAITVLDLENRLIYWNKGAQRLYGWAAEDALGKNADELLHKDGRNTPRLIEAKKSVLEMEKWSGELDQITKDGKDITVESRWSLVHSHNGKPKSILIINTDITEKRKLEAQFLRTQRMESIITLAGGIAHDLNNVLTPITLSLQLLKEKFTDEQSQKLIDILDNSTRRGADLIKQVLLFARGVEGERKIIQVAKLISDVEMIAKETFPKSIDIRITVPEDIMAISGDATQLNQVLTNLCINARDAMPGSGSLRISAENMSADENIALISVEAKPGPYIIISISDTGIGIPPEIRDRIFEPFFTTKEHGKGTGLGLSTVLAIVKSHGGFIDMQSEVGKGTTFKIYLPAVKSLTQEKNEPKLDLPAGCGELILVVDDEAPVREITCDTLEARGYKVLAACDGANAVELYAKNRDNIRVVLMDMMMPVMDGPDSIQVLRKISPEVKIIAVSGLIEHDKLAKISDTSAHAFLTKPYTTKKLLETINDVLKSK